MDWLLAEDDDFNIIQQESLAATGYKFAERVAILNEKMSEIEALIPECGIKNVEKQDIVLSICADVIVNLEEAYSLFVVVFPDPGLEAAIRGAIGKPTGDIYLDELLAITYLRALSLGIVDLSGLEYCTNLEILRLSYNQIVDISPLAALTNLQTLYLYYNRIVDISGLGGLTNLQTLSLSRNRIVDVGPLEALTNLQTLHLYTNQIVDISPLLGCLLNDGDYVDIRTNPLNDDAPSVIAELQSRGVDVTFDQ